MTAGAFAGALSAVIDRRYSKQNFLSVRVAAGDSRLYNLLLREES